MISLLRLRGASFWLADNLAPTETSHKYDFKFLFNHLTLPHKITGNFKIL